MELHPAPTLWDVLVNDHGDATVVVPDFSDTSAFGAARVLVNDVSPLSFAELEAVDDAQLEPLLDYLRPVRLRRVTTPRSDDEVEYVGWWTETGDGPQEILGYHMESPYALAEAWASALPRCADCGELGVLGPSTLSEHRHAQYSHAHAWAAVPHDHLLRQVCGREECAGCETHNVHGDGAQRLLVATADGTLVCKECAGRTECGAT